MGDDLKWMPVEVHGMPDHAGTYLVLTRYRKGYGYRIYCQGEDLVPAHDEPWVAWAELADDPTTLVEELGKYGMVTVPLGSRKIRI